MKIIFLSTGSGLRPAFINDLRAKLSLRDSDVVCLVSWHPPRMTLPVARHLVLGPHIRVIGALATVYRVQRRPEPFANAAEVPMLVTATATTPAMAAMAAPRRSGTAHLPIHHPRRVRQAVLWRVRRLKKAAGKQADTRFVGLRTHPQYRRVRSLLGPNASLSFAASCLRAVKVHDMARDADLVVALDAASHRGAWTLAQKVPGPNVVIGIPAAKQILEQREVQAEISSPVSPGG